MKESHTPNPTKMKNTNEQLLAECRTEVTEEKNARYRASFEKEPPEETLEVKFFLERSAALLALTRQQEEHDREKEGLMEKYKDEWRKAHSNASRETIRGYKKTNLRELGKQEAFVMILDDLSKYEKP